MNYYLMKLNNIVTGKFRILILIFSVLLISCTRHDLDKNNIPKKLIIGAIPSSDPELQTERFKIIMDYLEKKLDMEVSLVIGTDYATAIEAMKTKKIHIGYFGPFAYIIAAEKAGAEALVATGTDIGPRIYNSVLITHPKSDLKTLDDVIKHASELTLSFPDPASTSGHLIPRSFLENSGYMPEEFFKDVVFSTSHTASIYTIRSRKIDVAATSERIIDRLIRRGKLDSSDFHIIWKSEPIITSPISIRSDINPAFKEKVRQAFLDFPKEQPEKWKEYKRTYFLPPEIAKHLKYISVQDSMYDDLRILANKYTDLKFSLSDTRFSKNK